MPGSRPAEKRSGRKAERAAYVRRWCFDHLDAWPIPHERSTVEAKGEQPHAVTAGYGSEVAFIPGTNFNAATSMPLATAPVAAGHRVTLWTCRTSPV